MTKKNEEFLRLALAIELENSNSAINTTLTITMKSMVCRFFIAIIAAVFFSSCLYKNVRIAEVLQAQKESLAIPLFIEMPKNNNVFDHLSPLAYEILVHHFECVGYRLVSNRSGGYRLALNIIKLVPERKYVSPDILLFHATMNITCIVTLYDFTDTVVCRELVSFSKLFSKPRNPVMSGSFFDYEFQILLQRSMHKIEQKVRQFLVKKKTV